MPSTDFATGMKCRVCGKLYPKSAINFCVDDFGPLEVTYDYDRVRANLTRGEDREAAVEHVAVPRTPAARRRADRRPARRRHAAHPRRSAGGRARRRAALDQERRGQLPDALVQGSRRLGGAFEGPRVRHADRRLRQHRQPRQQRRGAGRQCGAGELHPRSRRPGADQDLRHRDLWREGHQAHRHLRRGEPRLHADRAQVRLGIRERQPAAVLRGRVEDDGLRDRRGTRLAIPATRRLPDGRRRAHRQDSQGVHRTARNRSRGTHP